MKKRKLYELKFEDQNLSGYNSVRVCRMDNNIGKLGYVNVYGNIERSRTSIVIPNYVIKECIEMVKNKIEFMKADLIKELKTRCIENVSELWAYSKDFYSETNFLMGGSYHSTGTYISVRLRVKGEKEINMFKIDLEDLK